MTSPGTPREFRAGPLYFFDQPTTQDRTKVIKMNILHLNLANGGARLAAAIKSHPENQPANALNEEVQSEQHKAETMPSETVDGASDITARNPDATPTKEVGDDPMDAYRRTAPRLLDALACLLSRYKWAEEGRVPGGLVNVLNYSWRDLTAGSVHPTRPRRFEVDDGAKRGKSAGCVNFDEPLRRKAAHDQKKMMALRNSIIGGNIAPSERKIQPHPDLRRKKSLSNAHKVQTSTTISFSLSSKMCKEQGWIIQPKETSCDEPELTTLCQWVVERLQMAKIPIKLQTAKEAEQGLNKPPMLRHYGDVKPYLKNRTTGSKAWPVTLVNGMPRIPEVKQKDPALQKLHYRINDGSSIIYYPSGYVAVCQSHSGMPCGGFYTNVFSDSECPVILASITAFGHGTITHPLSGVITATWDQGGGSICDPDGNVTKEWTWQIGLGPKEKIVIQVSDLISVRLFSGVSAVLGFRSHGESVELPLSALSNIVPPKEMPCLKTDERFLSNTAQKPFLANKSKPPGHIREKKKVLALKSVLQMVKEVEGLEEPSELWRGLGRAGRELRRLQRRVHNTLDDWLEYYRMATGIKWPDIERMPDAPLKTRLRREVQSAGLPSLNPPEQAGSQQGQPEEGRKESQDLLRHLSAPVDYLLSSSLKLPRTPKKRMKEESHITQTGVLRVHSNIRLDSVIIPSSPESQLLPVVHCTVQPSSPCSLCPALLRAALLGEEVRRLCRCSSRLMPVVTDLEYDAFITGQPPRSEQILVVCVTLPRQLLITHAVPSQDTLEQLYEKTNKNRTMPCTQCQTDSFRLLRYEMSTGKACSVQNTLLEHRHNAAPGMVLMYNRGKLLFVDYIFNGYSCSVRDLHKQISKTRGDYRLGLSLPPDYKFSARVKSPAARASPASQQPQQPLRPVGLDPRAETFPFSLLGKGRDRKTTQGPVTSLQEKRGTNLKAKKIPAAPH